MLALLLATTALHAEERRASRGERLALEGRCAVAIPELERELEDAPERARLSWRLGQCLLIEKRHAEAVSALEQAVAEDPSLLEAQLDLGRARYHARDLAGADAALLAAEPEFGEEAIWSLYRGMVALERGDARAAVASLERAVERNQTGFRKRADLQAVEPVASYYLGIALRMAGEEERAVATLRRVAGDWAGTEWASQAERHIAGKEPERVWITLGSGIEYDDNVILSGRDTPLPSDISDEEGFRAVWSARGGVDLGRWEKFASGIDASYRGRAHFDDDLRDFDTHFPTGSLWLNYALRADTHLRGTYHFGYAWVDNEPFVVSNGGRLSLIHAWSSRQSSSLAGSVYYDDYLFSSLDIPDGPGTPGAPCGTLPAPFGVCGPNGLNERDARDRDGLGATAGLSHGWSPELEGFPLPDPSFFAGYTFTYFDADGREYSNRSHRLTLGVGFALPLGMGLDLDGSYTRTIYRNPTTFPQQDDLVAGREYFLAGTRRRENIYTAGGRLSVPLTEVVSAAASYRYRDSRSTADVFDYDQHVVGLVFHVTLSR